MNAIVATHDLLMITLDTLRYDVARELFETGRTPNLCAWLGQEGWQERHTPASFTYAAHHAFFAGFLPTLATPGPHPRLFAARFAGSTTSTPDTCVFDTPDIVSGLKARGFHTACIGGVGFFNGQTALGKVLPAFFEEHHWSSELGVTHPDSTRHQLVLARAIFERSPQQTFLFINISALHQPNAHYLPGRHQDDIHTHAAALEYVDAQMPLLFEALEQRPRPTFCMIFADHGTAYGEQGFSGHRLSHPSVMTVPYAHRIYTPHALKEG